MHVLTFVIDDMPNLTKQLVHQLFTWYLYFCNPQRCIKLTISQVIFSLTYLSETKYSNKATLFSYDVYGTGHKGTASILQQGQTSSAM